MPDAVLLDVMMPEMDGYMVCERLKAAQHTREVPVVFLSALGQTEDKLRGFQAGGVDYIVKPFEPENLEHLIRKAAERKRLLAENVKLREKIDEMTAFHGIVGESAAIRRVLEEVRIVAESDTTVLVRGESGTGKELIAKAIHVSSGRSRSPFVAINCAAIPEGLLENELFGHVKGAFTDAVSETRGKFEIAGKGTLFLDEIGDVSPNLQSKLLRVIESRDFMKVGGEKVLKTEARIIAATNQNLRALIESGRFREDLYYRLKVVEIHLPSLRERRDDIPELVGYLLEKINRELRRNVRKVPADVMAILREQPWKGNVRELENALTRAVILAKGDVVLKENLPIEPEERKPFSQDLVSLEDIEKDYIRHVLVSVKGSKTRASQILKISRPTLDKKIKDYGLEF